MIRQATIEDAQSVLPIINIVFEEMEMPLFQEIPLENLFKILKQAFEMQNTGIVMLIRLFMKKTVKY